MNLCAHAAGVASFEPYLANRGDGLRVYDISTPTNVVNIGHIDNGGDALDVAVSGDYAYLANQADGLRTYAIGVVNAPAFSATARGFVGDGSGLTSLNASNLTAGTVSDARLSTNVAFRGGGNTFTGNQLFNSGNVGIGTDTSVSPLHVAGLLTSGEAGVTDGEILLENNGSSGNNSGIRTDIEGDLVLRAHSVPGDIEFETGNPESTRRVILQNGNVGVGREPAAQNDTGRFPGVGSASPNRSPHIPLNLDLAARCR